ncbi:lasso peptide biosynthesis B2 protein [Amycolatopsis sp. H20-H5]|uniref:lasso peptide biosynthesis B2 protein n=1 Tax=Amycolatopsis sp. H20-H5 TaxID=3046309 RepID=UPI002DBCB3FE|nr:lasso peptide biosynthesis B2 protein [Amycolatopsis sp. H20-H5]MEC3975573.1 lasso peptide biosynthesis B2 protein [Amycolatopsis sp. H20-H5]
MFVPARDHLPIRQRFAPVVAVGVARLLARQRPARLHRSLTWLSKGAVQASHSSALTARRAVTSVSTLCAGEGCLPRSIATALLCRLHGGWPTWHAGVIPRPFLAHAWVEAEGKLVGEPYQPGELKPVMTVAPRGVTRPGRLSPRRG